MPFHRRNLPHIENYGSTYFVNFSTKYKIVLPPEARSIELDHCLFEEGKRIDLHAVVVMPDHVHLLFTPLNKNVDEYFNLSEIMNGIKGPSSHNVNKLLDRRGTLWEPESFDRIIRTEGGFFDRKYYIIENPIAAGLAKRVGEYKWCWYK